MLDGFLGSYKRKPELTKKQKLEAKIKDGIFDLVLDRNISFLNTARQRNTSIIVQNRDGGVRRFTYDNRNYITFPTSIEDKIEHMSEDEQVEYIDKLLKLSTQNKFNIDESENQSEVLLNNYYDKSENFDILKDSSGNIDNTLFEHFKIAGKKEKKELDKDIEESEKQGFGTSIESKGITDSAKKGYSEHKVKLESKGKDHKYEFKDTDLNIDGEVPEECTTNRFYSKSENRISKQREEELKRMADQIVKSFKGRMGKIKQSNPSKRICSKTVIIDVSEKIYKTKKSNNGKHLNMNIIIDMSGSMSGTPTQNAIEMIYIFNEIAHQGYLKGSVLFSESSSFCIVNFPMPRKFIGNMHRTGGGEGLGRNLKNFIKELKEVDTNICMTDGCLTNEPILRDLYKKERIEILGVYVNEDATDLSEYTGSLNRWFTKSLVRRTLEELSEKIIQFGLRRKQR